jgi:hypothetical protein
MLPRQVIFDRSKLRDLVEGNDLSVGASLEDGLANHGRDASALVTAHVSLPFFDRPIGERKRV